MLVSFSRRTFAPNADAIKAAVVAVAQVIIYPKELASGALQSPYSVGR
jgi:hypothetical protein